MQEHQNHLRTVFQLLKKICIRGEQELEFLGHHVNQYGFESTTEKVEAIK